MFVASLGRASSQGLFQPREPEGLETTCSYIATHFTAAPERSGLISQLDRTGCLRDLFERTIRFLKLWFTVFLSDCLQVDLKSWICNFRLREWEPAASTWIFDFDGPKGRKQDLHITVQPAIVINFSHSVNLFDQQRQFYTVQLWHMPIHFQHIGSVNVFFENLLMRFQHWYWMKDFALRLNCINKNCWLCFAACNIVVRYLCF